MRSVIALAFMLAACSNEPEPVPQAVNQQPVAPQPVAPTLPHYVILNAKYTGGGAADVLVPSLTRDSPVHRIRGVAEAIAKKQHLGQVTLFCSQEAWKAFYSLELQEANPDALKCYLGLLKGGQFTL